MKGAPSGHWGPFYMDKEKLNTAIDSAKNGKFAHAEILLRELSTAYPDNPDVYNNLSIVLCEQKSFDDSISHSKHAIHLSPDRITYWHTLWKICEIGKYDLTSDEQAIFKSLFSEFNEQVLSSSKKKIKSKCAWFTANDIDAVRRTV